LTAAKHYFSEHTLQFSPFSHLIVWLCAITYHTHRQQYSASRTQL